MVTLHGWQCRGWRGFRGLRILQVRHPLPVIRSFTGTRFFSEPARTGLQYRFAAAHFTPHGDDVVDTMRWWVHWNELGRRHADMAVRLEDLDEDVFAEILDRLGVPSPDATARRAVARVSPIVNSGASRGERPIELNIADLPRGEVLDALIASARSFGYSFP